MGGLFSFELDADLDGVRRFVNALSLFRIGVSWGGLKAWSCPSGRSRRTGKGGGWSPATSLWGLSGSLSAWRTRRTFAGTLSKPWRGCDGPRQAVMDPSQHVVESAPCTARVSRKVVWMRIGFVGAGLMGGGMVKNLLRAGHDVTVLQHRRPLDHLEKLGARVVKELRAVAEGAEVVFLVLPGSPEVEETLLGKGNLAAMLEPGAGIIDSSTSFPGSTRKIARELSERGLPFFGRSPHGRPGQCRRGHPHDHGRGRARRL